MPEKPLLCRRHAAFQPAMLKNHVFARPQLNMSRTNQTEVISEQQKRFTDWLGQFVGLLDSKVSLICYG